MDEQGNIEIKLEGYVGARKLSPSVVDIDEIEEVLSQATALLFPESKRAHLPLIS